MSQERNAANQLRSRLGLAHEPPAANALEGRRSRHRNESNSSIKINRGEAKRTSVSSMEVSEVGNSRLGHYQPERENPAEEAYQDSYSIDRSLGNERQVKFSIHRDTSNHSRPGGKRGSNSPLRSKSGHRGDTLNDTYKDQNPLDQSALNYSHLSGNDRSFLNKTNTSRNFDKDLNSAMRSRSPLSMDFGASSRHVIRPQPIKYSEEQSFDLNESRRRPMINYNQEATNLPMNLHGEEARQKLYCDRIEAMTMDN